MGFAVRLLFAGSTPFDSAGSGDLKSTAICVCWVCIYGKLYLVSDFCPHGLLFRRGMDCGIAKIPARSCCRIWCNHDPAPLLFSVAAKKSQPSLRETRRSYPLSEGGISTIFRKSGVIVKPWTKMEKATTAKVTVMISLP